MESKQVKIGQIWARKDGRKVKITDTRISRGTTEFLMVPIDKGRESWKWDRGIQSQLNFISEE